MHRGSSMGMHIHVKMRRHTRPDAAVVERCVQAAAASPLAPAGPLQEWRESYVSLFPLGVEGLRGVSGGVFPLYTQQFLILHAQICTAGFNNFYHSILNRWSDSTVYDATGRAQTQPVYHHNRHCPLIHLYNRTIPLLPHQPRRPIPRHPS